jgi:hypothetical protein
VAGSAENPEGDQMSITEVTEKAIAELQGLRAELSRLGWISRLRAGPDRVPSLYVQNPEPGATALNEQIIAAPQADGWWFWWSWAERIAQDPAETAAIIRRALRSTTPLDDLAAAASGPGRA